MKYWGKTLVLTFLFFIIPFHMIYAETLEEQMNNLVGPKQQYNTMLSPVYLRNNTTEEQISPQSGELTIAQTDYVLPGRNGLDLEFKRIYKSGSASVQEMKVKYVNGAWVDYVESSAKTSSFYEDRYNLGIGMRFSFPNMEIRTNDDGTSHKFLHTDSGDVYRLKASIVDGVQTYLPEGQTIKDVVVKETTEFSNGQTDGSSKYVMTGKDGEKTYFAEDGRILGIKDRYGNTIVFEYTTLSYALDEQTITKKLMSKITDTIGRVTTIEYKEDATFTVGPITNQTYAAEESYKASQNPNNTDSGDLQGKFQVIVHVPGDKQIVYDKSAVLVNSTKHVMRTRLQRVFDVDDRPKYHFWYEQPDLGFTYMNGTQYAAYNRYENLTQIDYTKTNHIKQYLYNSYTKQLNKGSMQYRKIFEQKELVKTGYNPDQSKFEDRFIVDVKDKVTYAYTNEADGFGTVGYKEYDDTYLKGTYRYFTEITDLLGNIIKYTYDGVNQLLVTDKLGKDHKEILLSERDEMKLVKKQETQSYQVVDGQANGDPVKKIENYRYDEYGNLTNYTGPEAERDEQGYPINTEHTVVYSYAYDKFHVLASKTWKKDKDTTAQNLYTVDGLGNVKQETKINTTDTNNWIVTDYEYDGYGNLTKKSAGSGGQTFVTQYEYGTDANGADVKGAYLSKEYGMLDGQESAKKYAYDLNSGNRTVEVDARGKRTSYEYDAMNRVVRTIRPDNSFKTYSYEENPFANMKIRYTDPELVPFQYEYDIMGNLLQATVFDNGNWAVLQTFVYDAKGNKTKETDANGQSIRYEYDSKFRLKQKSFYEKDTVNKGDVKIGYQVGYDSSTPLVVTITDEEGYVKKYYYDSLDRLTKLEVTPDNVQFYATTYMYDYVGNKVSETDARGNSTRFNYDNLGRLMSRQDALGNETSYSYNARNQAVTQKEPGGKVADLAYDELGRVSVKKVLKQGSSDYTYTSYGYDAANNVTNVKLGHVTAGTDAVDSDVSYIYDALNQLIDELSKMEETRTGHIRNFYNKNGNKTSSIHYADEAEMKYRVYAYGYDFAGRVKEEKGSYRESDPHGAYQEYGNYQKLTERDYAGNVVKEQVLNGSGYDTTSYTYDYRNQVKEKQEPYGDKPDGKQTKYQYNKTGNRTSETLVIQGVDTTMSFVYDGLGKMVKKIDPLGNTARYVYDANGNRIKEIDPRYLSVSEEEAPGTEYEYDALNRLVKAVVFDGKVKDVIAYKEYDGRGNVVKESDGEGYNSAQPNKSYGNVYEYDASNRKTSVVSAEMLSLNEKNGTEHVSATYTYDGLGNVLSETDALGNTTTYAYYLNGLPKEKTFADGNKEAYDYDLTGKSLVVKTDRLGRVTEAFNTVFDKPYRMEYPDGTNERFVYSTKGELTERYDQAGNTQVLAYNTSGNPVSKKEFIRTEGTASVFKLTELAYDEANRLLSSETFLLQGSGAKQSAGDKTEYVYDKAGRLLKVSGPNGKETIHEYDAVGNLVTKKQKVANDIYDVIRYSYDVRSQLSTESLLVKTADLSLDTLKQAKYDNEFVDRILSTTSYSYYKNGKLQSQTDAQGNRIQYTYDYDGKPTKKTNALQAATQYRYDFKGNLVEEENAKGVSTFYGYDELDRLIRKKTAAADGSFAMTRYIYDAVGNLTKQVLPNDYEAAMDNASSVDTMVGSSYVFDAMNRRTSTISPDGKDIEYIQYNMRGQVQKVVDGLRYNGDMGTSSGTVFTYDGLGQMNRKTDALNNSSVFEYDVLGNVITMTDARDYTTRYVYNADKTLSKVTFADGGTVTYAYDKLSRKTSETNQLGNTTAYTYNAFGKEKIVKDPYGNTVEGKYDLTGNLVSLKDKRGSVSLFKYDGNKQLTEKQTPLELDESGNVVYAVEQYAYDTVGNVIKKSVAGSKDAEFLRETTYTYYDNNLLQVVSNNSGAYTKSHYDKNGNVILTEKMREASTYDTEKFEYDSQNRLIKRIRLVDEVDLLDSASWPNIRYLKDAEHFGKVYSITGYGYDVLGNRVKEVDPRAYAYGLDDTENRDRYTTRYTYDTLNRVNQVIHQVNGTDVNKQYTYDEVGNRIAERNERGFETQYTYDKLNRVEKVTDSEGQSFTYGYDLAGNKIAETNAKSNSMTYGYDKLNRLVTVTDPYNAVISKNLYDENGNAVKTMDAKGYRSAGTDEARYGWLYTYDLANRVVRTVDPEIAALKKPEKFTVAYQYNPVGERVKETDALGNSKTYAYDNAGRLVQVTDQLGVTVTYSYDMVGNKLDMTDGKGKVTRYRYGAFGLLREVVNAVNKSMAYRYNLALSVAEIADRNGNHTRYLYDSRNLLVERAVTETGDRIQYTYDEAGNRASMTDESGTSSYTYDSNNRLKQIAKDGKTQISYTYDVVGNIESVTDKTGFKTSYTYDKSSRMETVSFQGKTTKYSYDENGNRTSIAYEGGVKEDYTFDKNNRLLALTNKKSGGSIISEYTYTYDETGRQVSKTDSFGTTNYTYDAAGRVEKVEAPGKTTAYEYDKNGNRQTLNETYTSEQPSGFTDSASSVEVKYLVKKSEYMYSGSNELQQLVEKMLDAAGKEVLEKTTNFLYDDNGNELRQKVSYLRPHKRDMRQTTGGNPYGDEIEGDISSLIEKVSNTFDGFNRLKQVEQVKAGERVTVEYLYDGDDLRIRKTVRSSKDEYAAKVTNYLYDRQYVILETDAADDVAVRYVRGINYIARMDGTDKLSYYLFNGHGDLVQTVSESGEAQNQYDYDIFGNATLTVEMYANSIRYAGEFFDAEVGLYYLRARYYDPYIGRFISQDSYWGEDSNPLSLNLYTYVHNNPIMYVDPTGHAAQTVNDIIKAIDEQKEIWAREEAGAGSGRDQWTQAQENAHNAADSLRQELARLESGNQQVAQLVQDNGNEAAGDWESYKHEVVKRDIEDKIDRGEQITQQDQENFVKSSAMIVVAQGIGRDVVESMDSGKIKVQMDRMSKGYKEFTDSGSNSSSLKPEQARIVSLTLEVGYTDASWIKYLEDHRNRVYAKESELQAGLVPSQAQDKATFIQSKLKLLSMDLLIARLVPHSSIYDEIQREWKSTFSNPDLMLPPFVEYGESGWSILPNDEDGNDFNFLFGVSSGTSAYSELKNADDQAWAVGELLNHYADYYNVQINKDVVLKTAGQEMGFDNAGEFYALSLSTLFSRGKFNKFGSNAAQGSSGNGVPTIKNKFPDEALPTDGKILSYTLENGKIKGIDGRTEVDFVVDKHGSLVIGNKHHTLGNRDEVLAAGQLKINGQGEVRRITNESGHYRPTPEEAMNYPQLLRDAGVNVKGSWLELYSYKIDTDGFIIDSTKVVSKKLTE
ncbi:RHS repeat-associated core domain-containing protein [Paenibacillus qinlingensis]|uniref:RHS repeat-associated protein n=1 Tax=Paenibacillus qinlingensis TaxID=1837343 RepID=A0ABU1P148_9BACL|nr:RHS repeat-associated core domain-containing protein [Paenibacillus qinlingensis]MDR6553468.1 RHS repeat-associated protein [Paenibacillus qinlingensis]